MSSAGNKPAHSADLKNQARNQDEVPAHSSSCRDAHGPAGARNKPAHFDNKPVLAARIWAEVNIDRTGLHIYRLQIDRLGV